MGERTIETLYRRDPRLEDPRERAATLLPPESRRHDAAVLLRALDAALRAGVVRRDDAERIAGVSSRASMTRSNTFVYGEATWSSTHGTSISRARQ